jgi:DNA adenine methylase
MGGKRRLAKHILPLFPEHECYVEPFCGGAALYFMKEPARSEVINDINGELINLYRVVKYHLEALANEFKWSLVSRQQFEWHKGQPLDQLTDIQRAARFYYLQKCAFGGRADNPTFGTSATTPPKLNLMRLEEDLSQAHLRLYATTIEKLPWDKCVEKYDREHSLMLADPPYWSTQGYGVPFGLEQYDKMADMALQMKGKMIITVNDIPEMRKAFQRLSFREVDIKYTVSGGHNAQRAASSRELIITNF